MKLIIAMTRMVVETAVWASLIALRGLRITWKILVVVSHLISVPVVSFEILTLVVKHPVSELFHAAPTPTPTPASAPPHVQHHNAHGNSNHKLGVRHRGL